LLGIQHGAPLKLRRTLFGIELKSILFPDLINAIRLASANFLAQKGFSLSLPPLHPLPPKRLR
jgi:hypothetical protein